MTDRTTVPLPPEMARQLRAFTGPPAAPRPAATVVLLRPDGPGFSVYLLRRRASMTFGGVYAFPGGGVDPGDTPQTVRPDWAQRLGVPVTAARAVVGAAVRELFEEAGVLLAGAPDRPGDTVGDVRGPAWDADRMAVQRRELTLNALLARRGLRLRDDLLRPWARWITPEFAPKRFDTWFFVAALPAAQAARDVSGEADGTTWVGPAAADGLAMLPPTRTTLDELSAYGNIGDVLAAADNRDAAAPVMPTIELAEDGGAVLHVPVARPTSARPVLTWPEPDQPNRPVM